MTEDGFQAPDISRVSKRGRGRLPHWELDGATYYVTFRLADSLPSSVVERNTTEQDEIRKRAQYLGRTLTGDELTRLDELRDELERAMDQGYGACWLNRPGAAGIVQNAVKHFAGERYSLFAWAVMPNHVHVLFQPFEGIELDHVLHSWKSYTSRLVNKLVGRTGRLWEPESFDHLVRNSEKFEHFRTYILQNPVKAGLTNWPWYGQGSDMAE
jgi:REP element-mobilizing transposase RayT